ncbi:hypothetical protein [Methylococcus geothermalis]|uniref:Uncharacterized protein n=1 Tax=Methylococcus geothermalis TaxID=2681310 RepID=A0A858Q7X8_9GAMM|nr:hypothetical protein [Methylococcus geothermalis]QJD29968.1 hypothetical protein GNH96_08285 [Methylococcus geothermalis]
MFLFPTMSMSLPWQIRRSLAVRLCAVLSLCVWLSSSVGAVCLMANGPEAKQAADHCAGMPEQDTSHRATPGGCDKQASCFGVQAVDEDGIAIDQAGPGFPAKLLTLCLLVFIGPWAAIRRLPDHHYLRRPPPLPKVPVALRFCVLLN